MTNLLKRFPPKSFWRPSIAQRNMLEISDLWQPKNPISKKDTVATSGSCFAQHLSRAMIKNGFNWIDAEPAPESIPEEVQMRFGYGAFSFRTGNIYTTRLLRQWVEAAFEKTPLSDEIWEEDGRYYDPIRPAIEPDGFASLEECLLARQHSLLAMRQTLSTVGLFVFTLGLTESWRNRHSQFVYAACPGTLAGAFSDADHEFHNQTYPEIHADMMAVLDTIKAHNPDIKFLLTVSPVPLVATASSQHVLVSTIYSKSVLRAVAGDLSAQRDDTDYFPSYEIINSSPFRGAFFMPNQRDVSAAGVSFVMSQFFKGLGADAVAPEIKAAPAADTDIDGEAPEVVCEEELLEAFAT